MSNPSDPASIKPRKALFTRVSASPAPAPTSSPTPVTSSAASPSPQTPSVPVIFAADLHLRPTTWQDRPFLRGDAYAAFEQIIALCIKHGADLILGGDVFDDAYPDARSVQVLKAGVDAMTASGLRVVGVDGNHDPARNNVSWLTIAGAANLDRQQRTMAGRRIYFLNYRPQAELLEALKEVPPECDTLVLHQMFDFAFNREGVFNVRTQDIPAHIRLVLVGDFHEDASTTPRDDLMIIYNGSTSMQSWSEPKQKRVLLLTPQGTMESLPLTSRVIHEVMVSDAATLDQLVGVLPILAKQLRENVPPGDLSVPHLRVTYSAEATPDAEDRLRPICMAKYEDGSDLPLFHLWCMPFVFGGAMTDGKITAEQIQAGAVVDRTQILASLVDPEQEPLAHTILTRIVLNGEEVDPVLHDVRISLGLARPRDESDAA